MRRAAASLVLGVVVVAAASVQAAGGATEGPAASKIIDQTLRCTTKLQAGARIIDVYAQAGVREGGSAWKSLAGAQVTTRGGTEDMAPTLVFVSAGAPGPDEWKGLGAFFHPGLAIGRACRQFSANVPLSSRGLGSGGAAGPFGDAYECATPRQLLVRVRAVFRSPATLRLTGGAQRSTRVPVREARLVVQAYPSKRPLVYAEVFESGKARLFTAGNCLPD